MGILTSSAQALSMALGILPILDIYRKYYGWKVMGYIFITFYLTMAAAGYVVEFVFEVLGIIPQNRNVVAMTTGIRWNYTTILNMIFLVIAALLMIRFLRTGGLPMLKMMNTPEQDFQKGREGRDINGRGVSSAQQHDLHRD